MKKYFLIIFFFFQQSNSFAQNNVYFLDLDFLLNNSEAGKKIIEKLQKINDQNILKIQNYTKELKDEEEEVNRIKNLISKAELDKKMQDLSKKLNKYRKEKDKLFNDYKNLKNQELKSFFNKITPYIEEYMKKNSIKIILDKKNIFIADVNYDITNDLINFLNERIRND